MKKLVFITLLFSLLAGCSGDALSFLQTPTTAPINSPQPTVTLIPTREATNTPDLFALATSQTSASDESLNTPVIVNTLVPPPTHRPTITLEPLEPFLFTPSPSLFISVQKDTSQVVWGSTCEGSQSIRFLTQVVKAKRLKYVLLFYRLQDKYSGRHTEFGGGAIMSTNDQGVYFYTLELEQIEDYRSFEDAWLQYQFVASTIGLTVLGRSVVARTDVSVSHCKALNP